MGRVVLFAACLFSAVFCSTSEAWAWGAWGHEHINKGAVLALPSGMRTFFYNHIDYMVREATGPDLRIYTLGDKAEKPRHYINLEKYDYLDKPLPKTIEEAVSRYGNAHVQEAGTLPWHIQDMMGRLTAAFKKGRRSEILLLAADLGHYIGDAHMPLHTTVNHDGQITGQEGIHAFWECQLPEIFGSKYNLHVSEVHYVKDVAKATWTIIDSSYAQVTKLLLPEHKMKLDNPLDKQYIMGADGAPQKNFFGAPVHTYQYAHVYHELLGGMVERQMRAAIQFTADCWYTAWVNAGRPDLSDITSESVAEAAHPAMRADMKAWKNGKIRGCHTHKEFPDVRPAEK